MLQLRPTFSESWYRVAGLKPRLRGGAQMSRQYFRGERWYVVRDPAGNQFHRLSDPAYRFVGLLNGQRTVSEAWDLVGGQLADDAPTQPEVIQILSQLYAANLLETDVTPDATVLLRRHKQMVKRKLQGRAMNVLFPRIPIWDPDRFLQRWLPLMRVLFSKFGAVVWLLVIGVALATILPETAALKSAGEHALDLQHNVENVAFLYLTFILIKLIHELGHAFACRRFGGECHELGIMLLVLVPTPYVDASTAWSFPSKWQRAFVGAAGMIVELFTAALCAIAWKYTDGVNYPVVKELLYNAMFIASVTTIIFNINPLLRYDGYYILSDVLEIPNLRQKSTEYGLGLIKRHVFGLKLPNPLPPVGQRFWLLFYAVASSIYRVFVGIMIVLVVTYKVPVLGVLMAAGGVITWLVVPLVQVMKYLLVEPELHRKRTRACIFAASVTAAAVVLVGVVKFPVHVRFNGVVQPDDPADARGRQQSGLLKTGGDGRVVGIFAKDGQFVEAGQLIIQMHDDKVDEEYAFRKAEIDEATAKRMKARTVDQVEWNKENADLESLTKELDVVKMKLDRLQIKAPFSGKLVAPRIDELPDAYLQRGTEIGKVAVLQRLEIRGDIDQTDFELVQRIGHPHAEVRLAGMPGEILPGGEVTLPPGAVNYLVDPSLGPAGGGEIQTDPHDSKGMRTGVPTFEAHVKLDNSDETYFAGQRAFVRLTLDKKPLMWLWTVRFLQLIQSHDNGKWL